MERDEWGSCASLFPYDEDGDKSEADNQRDSNLRVVPVVDLLAGHRQRRQDEGEGRHQANEADNVEVVKELRAQLAVAEQLQRGFVVGHGAGPASAAFDGVEGEEQRQRRDRADDGPHANPPSPGRHAQHSGRHFAADPRIDEIWHGGDVAEEDASPHRGEVGDEDFHEQHDARVADLVYDSARAEGLDRAGGGLDGDADDVQDGRESEDLEAPENVGRLGGGRLGGDGDDTPQHVDGCQVRVQGEAGCCVGLVRGPDLAFEPVRVADEEDGGEDEHALGGGELGRDDGHAGNARRPDGPQVGYLAAPARLAFIFMPSCFLESGSLGGGAAEAVTQKRGCLERGSGGHCHGAGIAGEDGLWQSAGSYRGARSGRPPGFDHGRTRSRDK